MKLLNLFALSLLNLFVLIACTSPMPTEGEGVVLLSCKDFDAKLQQLTDAQLIDVRTAEEFAQGTIAAAVNIDFYRDDFEQAMGALDKERPIFVFCAKGGRSGKTGQICKKLGFKTIYDLDGGYGAWSQYKH